MKRIDIFFNELRHKHHSIWLENGKVKLSTAKELQNEEVKSFVIDNKEAIVSLLGQNEIFSKADFLAKPILINNAVTEYPLSFAQERLWFIEQFEEGASAYHIPDVYELDAGIDVKGVQYALQQIIDRHEVLRSTIGRAYEGDYATQLVHNRTWMMENEVVPNWEAFLALVKDEIHRPFDLMHAYPIRVKLYTITAATSGTDDRLLLLINIHHIASDGWSNTIFENELLAYYEAWVQNDSGFRLPAPCIQYKDYALWQRSHLTGQSLEQQLDYWKNKLTGYQAVNLSLDYARPTKVNYSGATRHFSINRQVGNRMLDLCREQGVTLFSVALASLNVLLSKYTGQQDIVIGIPVANRQYKQTENLIGFFVNALAIRTQLNPSQTFIDLVRQVQQEQTEAQLHQDLPFEKLVDALGGDRDTSRHPIFQTMLTVQESDDTDSALRQQKKYFTPLPMTDFYDIEKFDLSVSISNVQGALSGYISYATSLFAEATIDRLVEHYVYLLGKLMASPARPYGEISLLDGDEYIKVIHEWNNTRKDFPTDKTVHEIFEEQAVQSPDNIALVYGDEALTYRELNERSNQLARHIRYCYETQYGQPMAADTPIAYCMDRSPAMIVGMLAILKAGGAYVPIDPDYPGERIAYLLEDTNTALVLCQRHLPEMNAKLPASKLVFVGLEEQLYQVEDASRLAGYAASGNLAYIIYTSGTTGRPKGVMVGHTAILSLVYNNYIALWPDDVFAFMSSSVFDAATFEIFTPLLKGLKLVIPQQLKEHISDPLLLKTFLRRNNVSVLWLTKTLLENLFHIDNTVFQGLKYLLTGGEALDKRTINLLINSTARPTHIYNCYGPTESTTFTTVYLLEREVTASTVPIGRPINNRNTFVLDPDKNPCPIGVAGELYIGGAGLARGYWNLPALTAERFVENPLATENDRQYGHSRLYKTGDIVRWLPDGSLEYIGRNDGQVKIRGFRIEPTEIEQVLTQTEGIKQACVLVKERETESGSVKYLVAYYCSADNTMTNTLLSDRLALVLPEYMRPDFFVKMEAFPLTVNGKLDKKALPEPDFTTGGDGFVPPSSEIETTACKIWSKLIGLPSVGMNDNFFKIGGNSILAIQVSHRMSKELGMDIKVADIFNYKTIAQILEHNNGKATLHIPRVAANTAALSFAQERLWFIEQYEKGTSAYHMPALYELYGDTDIEAVKHAIRQIVQRHEVLRSTIEQSPENGHGMQRVHTDNLAIEELLFPDEAICSQQIQLAVTQPFDLGKEYPIRVKLYTVQPDAGSNGTLHPTFLLINIHHIANDGWSIALFERELTAYYKAYCNGDLNFSLPALDIQYKDYAIWQRNYLDGALVEKQLTYWKAKLAGFQELAFPTDYERPAVADYRGATEELYISGPNSQLLRELAREQGTTLFCVMLSSVNALLGKYTGQNDIVIGTLTANRHYEQTAGLIGFFANTQVSRVHLTETQNYIELIQQTHAQQIAAQLHQDVPFERLVTELEVDRDPSKPPVFQIIFTVDGHVGVAGVPGELNGFLKPVHAAYVPEEARFDLTIAIDDSSEELAIRINYATSLFHSSTIKRLLHHYNHLLNQMMSNPETPLSQFGLLDEEEYNRIVYGWNDTKKHYPANTTVTSLFEAQAAATPDAVAVVFEDTQLTYGQLNQRAEMLAGWLLENFGIGANEPVGIIMDRSDNMLVAILGILKAGAAYVCIDPEYPLSRKEFIIQDTAIQVLITHTDYMFDLSFFKGELFAIDIQLDTIVPGIQPQGVNVGPDSLAYIIYTSGTTGNPKGVLINHRAIVSLVCNEYVGIQREDVFAFLSSPSFDASTFELFTPLLKGNKLIIPRSVKNLVSDIDAFRAFLTVNNISALWLTKTLFESLYHLESGLFANLNYLIIGGEALNKSVVTAFANSGNRSRHFLNGYGPTESTTFTCVHNLLEPIYSSNVPLGKPINNRTVYVLGTDRKPVPVGVIGELYIGGDGLAQGYLNQPGLTAERFIPNPFVSAHDELNGYNMRLYKTGDLVRWLADGNLEYVGRNDDQVKIRGHRIELGEITHAMMQLEGVRQACVLVKNRLMAEGDGKYLVGYYVLNGNSDLSGPADILDKLGKVLPDYMMPGALVEMDSLPYTINGKLDKAALPDPDFATAAEKYMAPISDREQEMCRVWEEVLGLERVGVTDNFFKIGGDSILSIRLVAKMRKMGYAASERDIFECKTIQTLLQHIDGAEQKAEEAYTAFSLVSSELKDAILKENDIAADEIEDIYPAGYLQSGMLIEALAKENNDTYHDVLSFTIGAAFNRSLFEQVWTELVGKHEQLRVAFVTTNKGYFNIVHKLVNVSSKILLLEESCNLEQFVRKETQTSFDLAEPGIFRLGIIPDPQANKFVLVFSLLHAITDGWSVASIISEFANAYVHGMPIRKAIQPPYGKFIKNKLNAVANQLFSKFWYDYLAGYEFKNQPLCTSSPAKDVQGEDVIGKELELPTALNLRILALARNLNITPDIIFWGVYHLSLSRFYHTDDYVIGTVVNNRLKEEGGDRVFGLHLNTIPVRCTAKGNMPMKEYLSGIFNDRLTIKQYQAYPYAQIRADLGLPHDIYQCSFNYINFHISDENYSNHSIEREYSVAKSNIPLTVHIERTHDTFNLIFASHTAFADMAVADRLLDMMVQYLEQITANPDKLINEYRLMSEEDHNRIVLTWNTAEHQYPMDKTVHWFFEQQAARTPDRIALVANGVELNYRQLNEKTNQLARFVRTEHERRTGQPLMPDDCIALCLKRGPEMLISMLAVLKAGGAYVPIDPQYPQERIDYIIADTGAKLILCQKWSTEAVEKLPLPKCIYTDLSEALYNEPDTANLPQYSTAKNLAYVIYTSGTTGKPKGVMIQHESVVYYLYTFRALFPHQYLNVYAVLNYCFDASMPTLLCGTVGEATIHIAPDDVFENQAIGTYIQQHRINAMRLTPSLLEAVQLEGVANDLTIVLGGEKISYQVVNNAIANPHITIYNQYGPTESTVGTASYRINNAISRQFIGKPYTGKRVFVLDNNGVPVPEGVPGELYIGGAGLARGYFNQPVLTESRFLPNPFATASDIAKGYTRLYKTGDLVRWQPDGSLEYIGRNDDQVKIRGYRIELGEVEHALLKVKGMQQACALVKEKVTASGSAQYLTAYYVADVTLPAPSEATIRKQLADFLPDYMMPAILVPMDALPVTVNGKLDKRALPDPDFSLSEAEYVAPSTDTEIAICRVWQEILGLERVGVTDDFFMLGGHSILAIRVAHGMGKALKCDVKVVDVFKFKTIALLLENLATVDIGEENVQMVFN
jgi:amino acid adenylation domain-containing protein